MSGRTRVGIVFGGRSVEHEVSLVSARSVIEAIDTDRFEVVPIGVTKDGRWLTSGDPLALLSAGSTDTSGLPAAPRPALPAVASPAARTAGGGEVAAGAGAGDAAPIDVVFPLVHGIHGEDGTLQGLLRMADVPFVGADVLGSSVGMDKDVSRRLLRQAGLPVVETFVVRAIDWARDPARATEQSAAAIGLPCFVKPSGSGSSIGVSRAKTRTDLKEAIAEAFRYDAKVLVERAVDAREIEVAVLGNDDPEASVPGEIVPCNEFYDYSAKYLEESDLKIPADLDAAQGAEARRLALEAFRALEMAGMARVDLFLDRRGGALFVNEVNSIPGFTPVSMYPRLWEASGLGYRDLITRLIELALERHRRYKALETTFAKAPSKA